MIRGLGGRGGSEAGPSPASASSPGLGRARAAYRPVQERPVASCAQARDRGMLISMAAIIDDEKRAQRKARAIASDIYLYNKAKIEEAIMKDSFFEEMSEFITEGRDLFRASVTQQLFKKNFYDRAIVDRVIKPMAGLKSGIW